MLLAYLSLGVDGYSPVRHGEPRQRTGQGRDAGPLRTETEDKKPITRHENTDHRRKTEAKEDKNTSDARLQTQIYRRNSRTYQTHDLPRQDGPTGGTATSAYQEDERGRAIRRKNKVQDHRVTDRYQEGYARPGNHGTSHGTPDEGWDEEEQKEQGNNQGSGYRGQTTGGPTDQDGRTTTREQGRGCGGRGGGAQRTRPAREGD